ncbi:SDR family oxidoreductase [Fodinicola acaciae]|uniref:SDR family oxidoreductase n=1 Tax=Fodinicola acaciae TaxID=2681555 RepID=UPI0013D6736B|nr:SDR family oxidoreductase [Fodinicola acaciae]
MELGLDGKVALVGGASSGIGLGIATALAAEGVRVALGARRADLVRAEAERLDGAIGVDLDVRDAASTSAAVTEVTDRLGPVDILVLNGGGPPPATALEVTEEMARDAAELLLYGHLRLVAGCLPGMRERGWGRIVAVSSTSIDQPIENLATSGMFRSALAAYLKMLADQLATSGVTVNLLLPGRISTARVDDMDKRAAQAHDITVEEVQFRSQRSIPAGRYGTVQEFASAAAFLCSASAAYITGQRLRVDGGLVRGV